VSDCRATARRGLREGEFVRTRCNLVLVLLAFGLFATTACGARLTKEQVAAAQAGAGTGTAARGSTATGATAGTAAGAATGSTTGGTATGGTATGGDAGAAGTGGTSGGADCTPAPGSTDPGVSDTEIKLGNVSTITGPIPGFGETGRSGAKAYLNYLNNTQGGVCGRKLTLVESDDRLDAGANRSETERLKNEVFGFVGSTTVVDDGGTAVINGSNIANCSLVIGSASIASGNNFSPNPIDPSGTTNGTGGIWAWLKANMGITKVAVVYPAQSDARTRGQAYIPDIQSAGLAISGPYEVAITETNYAGVASKMKSDAADAVITTLEINGMTRLAQAFEQISYKPKVPFFGAQAYGAQLIKGGGSAVEGTVLGLTHAIFEDTDNPAMQAFVEWYKRTSPGSDPDFFSIMGWAAADMMAQAIAAAGPTPTRDKALAALQGMTSFDAHGMMAPRNPPGKQNSSTFMIAKVEGGQWKRVFPASGFGA
jgi:ABC-type branched-subunit amino acid transport system substrate-binding protein